MALAARRIASCAAALRPTASSFLSARLRPLGRRFEGDYMGENSRVDRTKADSFYPPSSVELWHKQAAAAAGLPVQPPPEALEEDDVFSHPLYVPLRRPNLSVGPLVKPLHFPEFDQSKQVWTKTGVPSPDAVNPISFIDASNSFTGGYPSMQPQYAALRDPFAYWDQQGRRNFGEIVHELDDFMNEWSPGPAMHWYIPVMSLVYLGSFIGSVAALIYFWDTQKHLLFAEKDYPFDGLRVELGGDPSDPSDNWSATHTYKI